jgi:hypothetical protein
MNVIGMFVGGICYYFEDSVMWPDIHNVPVPRLIAIMLIGMTLIPIPPSMDLRDCMEMYPLNGPAWTLFFDYIARFLYAIGARKFPNMMLSILVIFGGVGIFVVALGGARGDLVGGWALTSKQFLVGL